MHEAKQWHRRAYGGLVSVLASSKRCKRLLNIEQGEVNQMLPEQIGHAAAYEAYRTWVHNSSMYEPLSGDVERQREGLIGLAVAEGAYSRDLG
jgi:hypothetical protein